MVVAATAYDDSPLSDLALPLAAEKGARAAGLCLRWEQQAWGGRMLLRFSLPSLNLF